MSPAEYTYRGYSGGRVEIPTVDIQCDCMCSWTVIRAGQGRDCISRLVYPSALCRHKHVSQAPVPEGLSGVPGARGEEGGKRWVSL